MSDNLFFKTYGKLGVYICSAIFFILLLVLSSAVINTFREKTITINDPTMWWVTFIVLGLYLGIGLLGVGYSVYNIYTIYESWPTSETSTNPLYSSVPTDGPKSNASTNPTDKARNKVEILKDKLIKAFTDAGISVPLRIQFMRYLEFVEDSKTNMTEFDLYLKDLDMVVLKDDIEEFTINGKKYMIPTYIDTQLLIKNVENKKNK